MSRRSLTRARARLASACSNAAPEITAPVDTGILRVASPVASLLFARTHPTAVARTQDHKLRVLSLPDGKELRAIDYGDRRVVAFDLSADGSTVAIGDWSGLVSVWTTATGDAAVRAQTPEIPRHSHVLARRPELATAPQGDAVQILDAATGAPVATLGSPVGGTLTLAFSRDGRWVATGDGDTVVRIHDAATGKEVAANREFLMVPLIVAFSADGASVFAASGDKFVTIIDAATGKTTRKLDRTTQPMQALDVSPDGKSIATIFMKSEDMTQPDHVVVRTLDSWQPRLDWLPPTMPVGGGWTSDGRLHRRTRRQRRRASLAPALTQETQDQGRASMRSAPLSPGRVDCSIGIEKVNPLFIREGPSCPHSRVAFPGLVVLKAVLNPPSAQRRLVRNGFDDDESPARCSRPRSAGSETGSHPPRSRARALSNRTTG